MTKLLRADCRLTEIGTAHQQSYSTVVAAPFAININPLFSFSILS